MQYKSPLVQGQFLKRYKRFFADVVINGETVVAHVPNTGSLKGICDQGPRPCRLSPAENPERKLRWTLEQIEVGDGWIGVNTHQANTLAWEAFISKSVPHWAAFSDGRREVKISAETRFDMAFFGFDPVNPENKRTHFVEVKSVTLGGDNLARFPDAETVRGQKHLRELAANLNNNTSCEILFVVQRTDCTRFTPADDIDPEYGRLLREAVRAGVRVSAFPVTLEAHRIQLDTKRPLNLEL